MAISELSVLAPRENPLLVEQAAAEREFLEAMRCARMPHAWLICGPYGVGKSTFAFRCARFVLANIDPSSADDLFIDPEDRVFRQIKAGGHSDLLTITSSHLDHGQEIPLENVRYIEKFLRHTSSSAGGGWKVVIIDRLDQMGAGGHNAILKVLEEPPAATLFLLVASRVSTIPVTILSRCRRVNLPALSATVVGKLLERYHPTCHPDSRARLVGLAEGSIGRALDIARSDGELLYQRLLQLLDKLPPLVWEQVHVFADHLEDDKQLETAGILLLGWLARLIRTAITGDSYPCELSQEGELAGRLLSSQPFQIDRWLSARDEIADLFRQAEEATLEPRQVLLSAMRHLERAALGYKLGTFDQPG